MIFVSCIVNPCEITVYIQEKKNATINSIQTPTFSLRVHATVCFTSDPVTRQWKKMMQGGKKKKKRWWETDCDIALGKGNGLKYVSVRQKMDRQLFSKGPFIFFSLQPFNCLYLDSRESVRIFNVPMWESHHVVGRDGQNQLLVRCERTNMNSII